MDEIHIDNLKIFAHHGVFEHENINGQYFYVNAVLYTDTENAGISDNLELSTDYGSVCFLIRDIVTGNTFRLIETVAERIATGILEKFPLIKGVEIEVRKPEAPIKMDFESVSVKIRRCWHNTVIAFGSNLGDRKAYIENAIHEIKENSAIKDVKTSGFIETKPYGYTNQPDFLNGALICRTYLSPEKLLEFLHTIENKAGRTREVHWGARTLDLDIIFYDDKIIDTPVLTVPHTDMHNRYFVLKPISEIAPYYRHPVLNMTVTQLLERLDNNMMFSQLLERVERND